MSTLVIEGATILSMDSQSSIIRNGSILVNKGIIEYVGPYRDNYGCRIDDRLNVVGKAVLPGLINSHTHLCMTFGRTIGVERDLVAWLAVQVPLISAMDRDAFYYCELLGAIENIKNGNTTIVENIVAPLTDDNRMENAALEALKASGARGVLARCHQSRNFAQEYLETADQQDTRVRALAEQWHRVDEGRFRVAIGPQLPWLVDEDGLKSTQALARQLGLGLHMHVAENPNFNIQIAKHFGRPIRNVELLFETGVLGPDTQVVAVSDISDREIELLEKTNSAVVFDPQTRLYWGSGFAQINKFLDAGLLCAVATNGAGANCSQSIFESMKYACATAKTAAQSPTALGCRRSLRMATIDAAKQLGMDHEIGSIEVGKRADLITVDLTQPHLSPAFDVEAALVYSASATDVRDTIVGGEILMRDRKLQKLNERDVVARACELASIALKASGIDEHNLVNVRERTH
jgi:5-methylthioadenosine/S-adenosylhomocysteine deaminase